MIKASKIESYQTPGLNTATHSSSSWRVFLILWGNYWSKANYTFNHTLYRVSHSRRDFAFLDLILCIKQQYYSILYKKNSLTYFDEHHPELMYRAPIFLTHLIKAEKRQVQSRTETIGWPLTFSQNSRHEACCLRLAFF